MILFFLGISNVWIVVRVVQILENLSHFGYFVESYSFFGIIPNFSRLGRYFAKKSKIIHRLSSKVNKESRRFRKTDEGFQDLDAWTKLQTKSDRIVFKADSKITMQFLWTDLFQLQW